MVANETPVVIAELQLTLTESERALLAELLQTWLKEARVEEHRTRTPSYRKQILSREELIENLLRKIGR